MGGPFGQWAHQYDVPPRTHRVVREVWLPRATNIQAAYVDYVPFLFSLATFSYARTTNRSTWSFSIPFSCLSTLLQPRDMRLIPYLLISPFQPRCGFDAYSRGQYILPSFPYSTQTWISMHEVGFPLIVKIKVFICVTSRAEDSKLGRWWSGKRSTCNDVADGAIEQG